VPDTAGEIEKSKDDKMRDEIDGRLWAEHGHLFSTRLAALLSATMHGFRRLTAIEFAAPWRTKSTCNC
jgi:hypothetical protein